MSMLIKNRAKVTVQNQFDLIPSLIIETDQFGEVLFMNTYTLQLLKIDKNYSGYYIKDLLTNGSIIYFETYLLPCFKNGESQNEIFLTLKGTTHKIPALFNIKITNDTEKKFLFSLFYEKIAQFNFRVLSRKLLSIKF